MLERHTEKITLALTPTMKRDLERASLESGLSVGWLIREQLKPHYGKPAAVQMPRPMPMPAPKGS